MEKIRQIIRGTIYEIATITEGSKFNENNR